MARSKLAHTGGTVAVRHALPVLLTVVLLGGGCGLLERAGTLFSVDHEGSSNIPVPPVISLELEERGREQAAYAADVLGAVYASGVAARNLAVLQAEKAAHFLLALYGGPSHRLPVGELEEAPSSELAVSLEEGEKLLAEKRGRGS